MFRSRREALEEQMKELRHTMEIVDYKCWYYETAKAAGTVEALQNMDEEQIPERFREIRRELKKAPNT